MRKQILSMLLIAALLLSLTGCGEAGTVSVQRADQLALAGQAQDRYAGMVVSENMAEIYKDGSKTIAEVYVTVGQEVKEGDKLFTYDSKALELELEKAQLEVEKMKNELETYDEQLKELNQQLSWTWDTSAQVRLTLEINTLETAQMEAEYQLAAKETEILGLQEMLEHVDITSPVDGTVRQINEEEGADSYITIQQAGAYRIKGSINELSMGVIMEGTRLKIISRVDEEQVWTGTVTYIDYENNSEQNQNEYFYGYVDPMTTASTYPFYVEPDSTEGLRLGQHVYMELEGEMAMPGLWIPESYLVDLTVNEETGEMTAAVWAANASGRLEKRPVNLGMYDGVTGCYEVLAGLAPEDYVASPTNPGTAAGAAVSYRNSTDFTG